MFEKNPTQSEQLPLSIILLKTTYLRISLERHNFYHQNISHTWSIHNYFDHTRTGCPNSHALSLNIHISHCINCIVTNLDKLRGTSQNYFNTKLSFIDDQLITRVYKYCCRPHKTIHWVFLCKRCAYKYRMTCDA